jgi:hypothetical protein
LCEFVGGDVRTKGKTVASDLRKHSDLCDSFVFGRFDWGQLIELRDLPEGHLNAWGTTFSRPQQGKFRRTKKVFREGENLQEVCPRCAQLPFPRFLLDVMAAGGVPRPWFNAWAGQWVHGNRPTFPSR